MQSIYYTGDIGADINNVLSLHPLGGYYLLPPGHLNCATKINMDLVDANGVLMLKGQGMGLGYTDGGTLIDASGLSDTVIESLQPKYGGLFLSDFVVKGGIDGFKVVNNAGVFENLAVSQCQGNGFDFTLCNTATMRHWYAKYCNGTGIKFTECHASYADRLISRENNGEWAVEIIGTSGMGIGSLYIESNAKGALNLDWNTINSQPVRSLRIGSIYLENNNVLGTIEYEIEINRSNNTDIGNVFLSPSGNQPSIARIHLKHVNGSVAFGLHDQLTNGSTLIKGDNVFRLRLYDVSIWGDSKLDFTDANDSSRCQIINMHGNPTFIDPKNVIEVL